MTKKDYILLASAVQSTLNGREINPDYRILDATKVSAIKATAENIAKAMERDNPKFDCGKFLDACGFVTLPTIGK